MKTQQEKAQDIKQFLMGTRVDAGVLNQTIKVSENVVSPKVMLAAAAKLVKVNKREEAPDDRDNLRYSKFLGMEDYVKEHIEKDAGKIQQKAKMKLRQKRDLSWMHSGFFTPQIKSVVVGNGLSQNIEGMNPMENYDVSHKVTKLGEGGIGSTQAIPASSRQVNPSQFAFIDPLHMIESEAIGVTQYFVDGLRKGKDQKLYRKMKDKTGKEVWVDHETILNSRVKIPTH